MIRAALAAALLLTAGSAAADVLDRIRQTGEIRLAVRSDAAPLSALVDGVHQGYAVDVCRRLADRLADQLGLPALNRTLVPVDAENRFQAIFEGRADLLCGAASVTLERRGGIDFSIPIFVDGAAVLARAGAVADFDDLVGKTIGVRAGTTTLRSLRATLARLGMEAEVVETTDHAEGVAGVRDGSIDAYFADQSILYGLMRADGGEGLEVSGNTLSIETQALAMKRGESALRLEVDRALSRMWRAGEMGPIFEKAFAPAQPGEAMRALALLAPIPE
jgi:polar amino acid transport system substrate-binding protein/glutamate/aspartate transport system substrate-binding protein